MTHYRPHPNPLGLAVATAILGWGAQATGPFILGGEIQALPATLGAVATIGAVRLAGEAIMGLAALLEWVAARKPTGKSGTARWGTYKELKGELCVGDVGPFWGVSAADGKKLIIDFSSNAYVVGPSGSGKGHTVVVPMIFLIPHSKIIMDFKPELLCICKAGLEKRGQKVVSLNPFGKYTDLVGETDQLNVLDGITDSLFTQGGLRHVFSDSGELAMQLYEEPPNGKGDDQYWRNGTRKIIALITLSVCMIKAHQGTLNDVALLIDDLEALELRLCSIVGVDLEGKPDPQGPYLFELSEWAENHEEAELEAFLSAFRAKARSLLKQKRKSEKTFASFLEGAQQALTPFGFGELSAALGPTTFDFDAIKNGNEIINIFVVDDASRNQATEKFFGLTQWFMQLKLKRHPNKHVPVYLVNDEINNYTIYGYLSLLSWGRGFGIRTINFLQNFSAFEERYGKQAVDILHSESEIKLYLSGQRSSSTIKKIVELLGEQSLMVASLSSEKDRSGLREDLSESGRPLMTEDEVRRSKHGILIVREQRPILQQPVSYSEISPLRELADINPHHGKPFLNKVKLKLKLPKS